jgi:hypothetical protein
MESTGANPGVLVVPTGGRLGHWPLVCKTAPPHPGSPPSPCSGGGYQAGGPACSTPPGGTTYEGPGSEPPKPQAEYQKPPLPPGVQERNPNVVEDLAMGQPAGGLPHLAGLAPLQPVQRILEVVDGEVGLPHDLVQAAQVVVVVEKTLLPEKPMLLNQTTPMWSLPAIWMTLLSILMLFLWLPCKASIIWLLTNSQVWARVPGRETDFSS